jgi:hypothetical protein
MGFLFYPHNIHQFGCYITVNSAAGYSGYNQQYIRRLLRMGLFRSKKIGQIWLTDRDSFLEYLDNAKRSKDKSFGPQTSR